jgi:hypothetical protein
VKAGLIDDATVLKRTREVLHLRHLREQSPLWLRRGVDALIAVNLETGVNLMRKGWVSLQTVLIQLVHLFHVSISPVGQVDIYFNKMTPEFVAEARAAA